MPFRLTIGLESEAHSLERAKDPRYHEELAATVISSLEALGPYRHSAPLATVRARNYYEDEYLTRLLRGHEPLILSASLDHQEIDPRIDNTIVSGNDKDPHTMLIKVNSSTGELGGDNGHLVGVLIDREEQGVFYIDPRGRAIHPSVANKIHVFCNANEGNKSNAPIYNIRPVYDREHHPLIEGNQEDCGPMVVHAIRTLCGNNERGAEMFFHYAVQRLRNETRNISTLNASQELGDNLRSKHQRSVNIENEAIETFRRHSFSGDYNNFRAFPVRNRNGRSATI